MNNPVWLCLTGMNGLELYVRADRIDALVQNPEMTVLCVGTEEYVVKESVVEILERWHGVLNA